MPRIPATHGKHCSTADGICNGAGRCIPCGEHKIVHIASHARIHKPSHDALQEIGRREQINKDSRCDCGNLCLVCLTFRICYKAQPIIQSDDIWLSVQANHSDVFANKFCCEALHQTPPKTSSLPSRVYLQPGKCTASNRCVQTNPQHTASPRQLQL